jgi:hypothetical protein
MFGWIGKWIEKKVYEWIAGKLGVSTAFLKAIIDDVLKFIKMIIDELGQESPVFFRKVGRKGKLEKVEKDRLRKVLKQLEEL